MSSEPQHGPLPWKTSNTGAFEWPKVVTADDLIVAEVLKNGGHERTVANAALIVRAVNSLQSSIAAMEAALEHIGHTVPMSDNGRRERDEAMAQLRAAIKLAKGETNAQS